MYLLVDGDYLLSGLQPSSEDAVKAAVERLLSAVEQQLLLKPDGVDAVTISIECRIIFFSSALLEGLEQEPRTCVISTLRRLRFQTHILESIRGRPGTPVDAAMCSKLLQLSLLPTSASAVISQGKTAHSFCLVTPNAYVATALEVMASRDCGDVVFTVYEGDEVAEELLGYASPRYGTQSGVATMPRQSGVTFLPDAEAAIAALDMVQYKEEDKLSIAALTELKALQVRLKQKTSRRSGAVVAMPKMPSCTSDSSSLVRPASASEAVVPLSESQPMAATAPLSSTTPTNASGVAHTASAPSADLPPTSKSMNDGGAPLPHSATPSPASVHAVDPSTTTGMTFSFFESGPPRAVTTATSPSSVVQRASPPVAMPPPLSASPFSAGASPAALASIGEPQVSTILPPDWALLYDATRHRHYYAYTDTQGRTRSTWQHPLGPEKQLELEKQVETSRLVQQQQRNGLPIGWEKRLDPVTNRAFYVDHLSHNTTWECPQPRASNGPLNATGSNAPPSLLPPWESRVDPTSGRIFYINHDTATTSWDPPAGARPTAPAPTPPAKQAPPNSSASAGRDGEWVPRVDPDTGRTFYVNDKTRQTSWTKPIATAPTWEARVDPSTGRTFYVNHVTKATAWEPPVV